MFRQFFLRNSKNLTKIIHFKSFKTRPNKNKRNGERKEMKKGSIKILLIGSNGQLGHDFQELFKNLNIEYIAADYEELNIANDTDIEIFFKKNNNFTHIIIFIL